VTPEEKKRDSYLRRTYGITNTSYMELLDFQRGCCAICNKPAEHFNTRLAVDHDHVTGEIRGLLCNYCNHRVIGRHRDPELLRVMAEYVSRHTGWFVPKKKKKKIVK